MSAEMIRETEYTSESSHAMHLAGTCKHCGNATLIHIIELNLQTCAFCHHSEPETRTHFNPSELDHKHELGAEEHINKA